MSKSRNGKIPESNLCEKAFDKILGPVLTNSKDWYKERFVENDTNENDDTNAENIEINNCKIRNNKMPIHLLYT